MSLCIIFLSWMYSSPATTHAIKNPTQWMSNEKIDTCLVFCEAPVLADVVTKVTSIQEVHDKVEIFSVLKGIVHVHDKWIVNLSENLALVHDRFNASLCNNSGFTHFFHGVLLLRFLPFYLPDLAKATLANAVEVSKISLGQSYGQS